MNLPAGFKIGAATAAFQIEGAAREGGRTDSIWDAFCRVPGAVANGDDGDVACDHYHRMPADVQLISELGFQAYRFSTSWARVCPDGGDVNPEGIGFYADLVDELTARGVEPWLTLYHWDMPQALQEKGGWAARDSAYLFADYAEATYRRLGGKVRHWSTLNEPWCSSFLSYAAGEHAPGHTAPSEAVDAVHHLLLAHGLATERIRRIALEEGWDLVLGITLNFAHPVPADPDDAGCQEAVRRVDGATARVFLDPLFRGQYPDDVLADMAEAGLGRAVRDGDLELISQPLDFLGINFYGGSAVAPPEDGGPWGGGGEDDGLTSTDAAGRPRRSPWVGSERTQVISRGKRRTAMGWEVDAADFADLLRRLHSEYTGPAGMDLVITENGAAYDDYPDETGYVNDEIDRGLYYREHLDAVARVIGEGVPVTGYFAWSLLDNFEWAFGYEKRFGIVRVDYDTQERTPKWTALRLGELARSKAAEAERA